MIRSGEGSDSIFFGGLSSILLMKDLNLTCYRCCEGSTLLFFLLVFSSKLLFLNSKSRSSDFELLLSISTNKLMKYQIRLNTVKKISEIRISSFKQRRILARWSASLCRSQRLNRTGSSTIALEELASLAPTHRSKLIIARGSCSQLCPIWCLLR